MKLLTKDDFRIKVKTITKNNDTTYILQRRYIGGYFWKTLSESSFLNTVRDNMKIYMESKNEKRSRVEISYIQFTEELLTNKELLDEPTWLVGIQQILDDTDEQEGIEEVKQILKERE